jgi:hypothetical protein
MAWFEEGTPFKKEIRDKFANAASTVLDDAVKEVVSGPSVGYTGEMEDRTNVGSIARMEEQGYRMGVPQPETRRLSSGPAEAPIVPGNLPVGGVPAAETWEPWTAQTPYDKRRMAQEQYAGNISGRHPDVTSEMAAALPSEQDFGMQFEDIKQASMASREGIAGAETWGPGPTESVLNQQIDPAPETWEPGPTGPLPGSTGVGERHADVMAEAGALPPVEKDFGQQLVEAVATLLEKMKGFSLSPEEFAEISNMSPEQLTEVYNNLARQQGRNIHPNPQAWNRLGGEPFQSPESSAIFQGRVPMSEEVIRPGESAYSQWNIPFRETDPGFMAQDYAQAQPGTTDWMRQIYPWARNLPENILERAVQDGDYLRTLMQKAEAGELLPLM